MGMLTLNDVVGAHQQGVEWRQQQEQVERARKAQAISDEADKAATGVIEASKAQWAANGAQGEYRPNDDTMLRAAEVRGLTFAKGGDWQNFMRNEAAVQGQRHRVRLTAMQQYGVDGDVAKLAQRVYPTIFNGKKIVGTEIIRGGNKPDRGTAPTVTPQPTQTLAGATQQFDTEVLNPLAPKPAETPIVTPGQPGNGLVGAPTGPEKLRLKFSDGSTETVEPQQLVTKIKQSLIDPQKQAEMDAQLSMLLAKNLIETAGRKDVERVKGDQDRQTEGVKATNATNMEGFKQKGALSLATVNNEADAKRAAGNNEATRYSADTGAAARVKAAEIGKEGKAGGKDPKPGDEVKDAENLLDTLAKGGISGTRDVMSGVYKPDGLTQKAAQRINQYRKSGGLSYDEAFAKVRGEMTAAGLIKEGKSR